MHLRCIVSRLNKGTVAQSANVVWSFKLSVNAAELIYVDLNCLRGHFDYQEVQK
jgi:hypothetical protein